MSRKILITYATKAGSTKKVATRMAELASQHGFSADLLPVSAVKSIDSYDTVVLGSAVRMGRVLPEAQSFVEKNQAGLKQKEFDTFALCMTLSTVNEENLKKSNAFLDPIKMVVEPAHAAVFPGEINLKSLGWLDRKIIGMVKSQVGDFQDWIAMETWMESVLQSDSPSVRA